MAAGVFFSYAPAKRKEANMSVVESGVLYTMNGVGGQLDVYEDKLTITLKGVMGLMTKGLKGSKTIPFISITAIQFKQASSLVNGYLQFTVPGGNESAGGITGAVSDENSFMFRDKKNNEMAQQIKDYIESTISKLHAPQAAAAAPSLSDELLKLSQLKDQGILTDEEFQAAKEKLMG